MFCVFDEWHLSSGQSAAPNNIFCLQVIFLLPFIANFNHYYFALQIQNRAQSVLQLLRIDPATGTATVTAVVAVAFISLVVLVFVCDNRNSSRRVYSTSLRLNVFMCDNVRFMYFVLLI